MKSKTLSKAGYFRRFQTFAMNRMVPFSATEKDGLSYWRARILFAIIFSAVLIGSFALGPTIAMLVKEKIWGLLIFDIVIYLIGIGLLFSRRPRYEIRVSIVLLSFYAVGLVVIISMGPLSSGGPAWLFAFAVLSGVLLGSKAVIMALTVNAATLTTIGLLINAGLFGQRFPFFNTTEAMIVAGLNFMLLNTIAAISVAVLVKGLVSAHQKESDLNSTLEKERSHLIKTKKELELEVAERIQAEEALRESERRYRNIFENIQDVYYEATLEGIILEISPSIENASKYKRKELIGKSVYDIYTNPEEREELIKAVLVSGKLDNFEIHLTDKDGSQHSVELNMTLQRDQKGNPIKIIGSMRDISERKRLEARLRQSYKMETVGALAGGIAHEFNNILGTIIGNTELAIVDVPEGNPAMDCLKEIQTASLWAKDLVRQILGFAGKSVFQLMPIQISPIIRDALILIRASIPATIEIRENISCESDMVMADPTQINQVLTNLCINAKNAMQEKDGVLEVKLENTSLDETSATLYEGLSSGNYVKLTVKDSGHGIDPKNIDRIFDPYFTTTSLAEGPGMGLAVVYGIVKHHNGAITVASKPGKGTVFEVLFPLTEAEAEQEAGEAEALPTGNEKILFVDDEASLVKMAKRRLEMQGYQVEAKSDPVEALELFRSKPDRFDLIITDMTMPKMTGDKLAKEILSIRPDMPIILCSGFSKKIDAEKAKELGIRKYIEKPLYMSEFVMAVHKVLDQ